MEKLKSLRGKYRIIEIGGDLQTTLHLQVKKWFGWISIKRISFPKVESNSNSYNWKEDYKNCLKKLNIIVEKLNNI